MYQLYHNNKTSEYQKTFQVGSLMAKILETFNWDDEDIREFIAPVQDYKLENQELIQTIASRLNLARERNEKVFVFGDYDCDGICATTLMVALLKKMNLQVGFYIPNRLKEGYGLNLNRLQQAIDNGYQLIITVDNGVKAQQELAYCNQMKIDTIVIDHHEIEEAVDATILFHPSCLNKPYHYLCGTGLVYTLAASLNLLDDRFKVLAMLATLADMMILKGENRFIVKNGLERLKKGNYRNIDGLLEKNLNDITETDIAFYVVPKINSIGRLADIADANQAVKYLLLNDNQIANDFANKLNDLNRQRKQMTTKQLSLIDYNNLNSNFVVCANEQFHPGLVGLIANRITREYNIPSLIISYEGNLCSGSMRGIEGFSVIDCLMNINDHLIKYGGHQMAAGISFDQKELEYITNYLQNYHYDHSKQIEFVLPVEITELEQIKEVFSHLPFGQGVTLPKIYLKNVPIAQCSCLKKPNYIKFKTFNIDAIWFSKDQDYHDYLNLDTIDMIGQLQYNLYHGKIQYQLIIEIAQSNIQISEKDV